MIDQFVIVRTYSAGVHFGLLTEAIEIIPCSDEARRNLEVERWES